jgi:hypothetical protein
MPEHYTRNTESVTQWCAKCGRPTQHRVSAGRLGRCMEHEAPNFSQAQLKLQRKEEDERRNPPLFQK